KALHRFESCHLRQLFPPECQFAFALHHHPRATCISVLPGRPFSIGSTHEKPAASFSFASKTPISSAQLKNQPARSSKASSGSGSTTTRISFSSQQTRRHIATPPIACSKKARRIATSLRKN